MISTVLKKCLSMEMNKSGYFFSIMTLKTFFVTMSSVVITTFLLATLINLFSFLKWPWWPF